MPNVTNWQHPRFFAYFPSNTSPPSILAEWLTATMAANCLLANSLPALKWKFVYWMVAPDDGAWRGLNGIIQTGASN